MTGIADTKSIESPSIVTQNPAPPAFAIRAQSWLPFVALLLGMLGISMSAIFIKWADVPGPISGFYRMLIATSIIALPFARQAQRQRPFSRRHLAFAIIAGLFFAGDVASYGTAVLITSAASATLLGNTAPLWVGIGAMFVFGERLRPAFWVGLLIAMVGVLAIIGQDFVANPHFGAADLLGLVSGFCYGMFLLSTERARVRLPSLISWWVSAAASLVGLLVLCVVMGLPLVGYSPTALLNLVGLAVVTQVGGWLSLNYALGHLRASVVAPTLLAQPVLTALIAIPLLDQPLGVVQIIGGTLVLTGIFIVHRIKRGPTADHRRMSAVSGRQAQDR